MAVDFPNNPVVGEEFVINNVGYLWDGFKWTPKGFTTGGGGMGGTWIGPDPPGGPTPGMLWFDTDSLQLFVWFDDGTSAQWVVSINQVSDTSIVATAPPPSPIPPANPTPGTLWFDSDSLQLFVWFDDGSSAQWVVAINQKATAAAISALTNRLHELEKKPAASVASLAKRVSELEKARA